jgi:hypothetical protein
MKRTKLTDRSDIAEIFRGSEQLKQQDRETVKQSDSIPANQHAVLKIKATFYLEKEDLSVLERERFNRRAQTGRRRGNADLSALVREAIRKTYGGGE